MTEHGDVADSAVEVFMSAADQDPPHDAPPERDRARRPRPPDEPERPEPPHVVTLEPLRDLPGAVFMVPNAQWGFASSTSEDHPGACLVFQSHDRSAVLLQGTDAARLSSAQGYYVVPATPDNGLLKPTAFRLEPRYFRLHKVRLFYPERYLGRLDDGVLLALCDELARLHPEE
jgi:hypothetical protein